MPHSLTMLVRGLTTIEGVIAQIAPDINVVRWRRADVRKQIFCF